MYRVSFSDLEPSEKEFFEEYDKYNTGCWFLLVFILRSFSPFCLELLITPFRHPDGITIFKDTFDVAANSSFCKREQRRSNSFSSGQTEPEPKGICKDYLFHLIQFDCLGYILGGILGGILGDLYGRRPTGLYSSLIWVLSVWGLVFSEQVILIMLFYFVAFTTCSIVFTVTFANLAEIANKKYRFLINFTNTSNILATLVSNYLNKGLPVWTYLISFIAITTSVMIFICWYIPESPRWLLNKNKRQKAYEQLNDISGLTYDITEIGGEIDKRPKVKILYKMSVFLFRKKKKYFLVTSILTAITYFNFNNSELKAYFDYISANDYIVLTLAAKTMSYLLFMPLYIFFGKRYGLLIVFIAMGIQIATTLFIFTPDQEIYYSTFSLLFSATAVNFNYLFCFDLFPTFLRATVLGFGLLLFGLTKIISLYVVYPTISDFVYYFMCLIMNLFGLTVLMLPEIVNQELINTKLS